MKNLNAGLIGYKFMGRAHSNAFRQVNHFFNADTTITLRAICGRDETSVRDAAGKFGFESYETDWKKLIDRDDIDFIDITSPGNATMRWLCMPLKKRSMSSVRNHWPMILQKRLKCGRLL